MRIYLEVEVERTEGKFVSKEDIASELIGLIDGETLSVDDSSYDVVSVSEASSPDEITAALDGPKLRRLLAARERKAAKRG